MNTQNFYDNPEFSREHQEIPERDTTDSDRPRIKPRVIRKSNRKYEEGGSSQSLHRSPKKLTKKKGIERDIDEVLSFSSEHSEDFHRFAMDNKAYIDDETDKSSMPLSTRRTIPRESPQAHSSTIFTTKSKNKYISSDSESEMVVEGKTEILMADVHFNGQGQLSSKKKRQNRKDDFSTTTWEEDETILQIENDLNSKMITRPRPRPRSRTTISSHSSVHSSTKNIQKNVDFLQSDNVSDKEEYLTITIPPEKEPQEEVKDETLGNQPNRRTAFMERWKKTAQNFLKSSSSNISQPPSLEPIEEPKIGKLKSTFLRSRSKDKKKPVEEKTEEPVVELSTVSKSKRKDSIGKESLFEEPVKLAKSPPKDSTSRKSRGRDLKEKETPPGVEDIKPEEEEKPVQRDTQKKKPIKEKKATEVPDDVLLGITIHSSDILPMDPNVLHPVVKVTVMDEKGRFLVKNKSIKGGWRKELAKQKRKRSRGDDRDSEDANNSNDDEKQNDTNVTKSENSNLRSGSVLPIMTQACRVNQRMPTFAPTWGELLLFDEPFQRFLHPRSKVVFFFEIMDFLPMEGPYPVAGFKYHGSDTGWYKVAWAFLKPIGANGIENIDRKLRLQLFEPVNLRTKELVHGPEVFCWWKLNKRQKLNSTLYVTVKGIQPPQATAASLRTLLTMGKDDLTHAILESQLTATKKSKKRREKVSSNRAVTDLQKYPQWTRLEGQSCKVPNRIAASLPSSQVASLNLIVSGNVYCVSFSPCGLKMAAGLDTDELHVVLIFEVPSGNLLRSLKGHHGLIYDLSWKILEIDDNDTEHYLGSASADSTAIIWKMDSGDDSTLKEVKKLLHPSFVYCVKFHPSHPSLVATGCFDYIIRVWDIRRQSDSKTKGSANQDSTPVFLLDRHNSFVNCLLFNHQGLQLFSGDGLSFLYKWSLKSPSRRKSWKIDKDIQLSDTGRSAINSLCLHPAGTRLLVHIRDSCIKILDVESFVILQSLSGLSNDKLQIRSCFSPCGNLVLSGSEDATLCIWDTDTGAILQFITPENHPNCVVTSVDYHPYDHYVVIGLSSTISEPNPILVYTYEPPKTPKLSVPTISKMRSSIRRQRSKIKLPARPPPMKKTVSFAEHAHSLIHRGDSSEKFLTIIRKLDSALLKGGAQAPSRAINKSVNLQPQPVQESESNTVIQKESEIDVIKEIPIHEDLSRHAAMVEERLQQLVLSDNVEKPCENVTENVGEIDNIDGENDVNVPILKPRIPRPRTTVSRIPVRQKYEDTKEQETQKTELTEKIISIPNTPKEGTFTLNTPKKNTFTVNTPEQHTFTVNSPRNSQSWENDEIEEQTYLDSNEVLKNETTH